MQPGLQVILRGKSENQCPTVCSVHPDPEPALTASPPVLHYPCLLGARPCAKQSTDRPEVISAHRVDTVIPSSLRRNLGFREIWCLPKGMLIVMGCWLEGQTAHFFLRLSLSPFLPVTTNSPFSPFFLRPWKCTPSDPTWPNGAQLTFPWLSNVCILKVTLIDFYILRRPIYNLTRARPSWYMVYY